MNININGNQRAYMTVVEVCQIRSCIDVCPHKSCNCANGWRWGWLLRRFRFRRKSSSPSFQVIRSDHYWGHKESIYCFCFNWSVFVSIPSLTIPTARHFWNRQNWHLFLRLLSTGQSLFPRHTYLAPFCTVLLKNPLHPEW